MSDGLTVTLDLPLSEAADRVRAALKEQGFGVLTEIDLAATLEAKLGEHLEDYLVLGACNPALAFRALEIDRRQGLLLPCNVVLRRTPDGTLVEVADPAMMTGMSDDPALEPVAAEARERLSLVVEALAG